VASFLRKFIGFRVRPESSVFSSLSESGFIPTREGLEEAGLECKQSSHLFQRVASFLQTQDSQIVQVSVSLFSSLSESGFIPTEKCSVTTRQFGKYVLISFREWLHSYPEGIYSFREMFSNKFSSLSESGFIPTPFIM